VTPSRPLVLIVSAEEGDSGPLSRFLRAQALDVVWARDDQAAHPLLEHRRVDCLITELRAARIEGVDLLRHALARNPDLCAVVVAEPDQVPLALEAMREGAVDFQFRPIHFEKLLAVLDRGLRHHRPATRRGVMEERLDERPAIERFAGVSRAMERVREQIVRMSASRGPVLIEGESGTGKSLAAQALHHHGPASDQPVVGVSFEALPTPDAEARLFGTEAEDRAESQAGALEQSESGTLVLDEVGEASPSIQVRLLRLLQDREFERIGGRATLRSQARLVATTARDLSHDAESGRFRADLLRRLSALRLSMPPLRERTEDIPALIEMFVADAMGGRARRITGMTPGLLDALTRHSWPGNVRELRGVIDGLVAAVERRRTLDVSDLPPALRRGGGKAEALNVTVGMTVEEVERSLIRATLRHTGGDKTRAAAMLGIALRTLYRRIRALGLG